MHSNVTATIATSIMPRRIDVQQIAIRSWQQLGFNIVSVNVEAEVAALAPLFEGVTFFPIVKADPEPPLISINQLLEVLRLQATNLCGIINSDIILSADAEFIKFVWENTESRALLFGPRIDVDDAFEKRAPGVGYDYFFFRKADLPSSLCGNFTLGATWWDYWFPISLALDGFSLRILLTPVASHPQHDQQWGASEFTAGQAQFISAIRILVGGHRVQEHNPFRVIIEEQGLENFATHVTSILLLDSEPVIDDRLPVQEALTNVFDLLRVHRRRYEELLKTRSWRWTAPARAILSRVNAWRAR